MKEEEEEENEEKETADEARIVASASPPSSSPSLAHAETPLVLGTRGDGPFTLDANLVATGRTCVLGTSGSGKSYALGVICEELCKSKVPFAIVDAEGEYFGLKTKYDAVWVAEEDAADIKWNDLDEERLGAQAIDLPPLILDLSELENGGKERISKLLTSLYRSISARRTPYLLIVEEADRFVPQVGDRLRIFGEIARRGRKRGLGLMICSQRPSLIDKNVLSQCANQLIGKLVIQNDLQSVAQFFPGRGLPKELTTLTPGMFYVLGGLSPVPSLVQVRERETTHGGGTPVLGERRRLQFQGTEFRLPDLRKVAPSKTSSSRSGLPPLIGEEEVLTLVKREKSFVLFGQEETVVSRQLHYRTFVELGVRLRTGVIHKRFETLFAIIEGERGRTVSIGDGLSFHDGLERFIGLGPLQITVLRSVSPDRDSSILEIASNLEESNSAVRRALSLLDDRRLVRSSSIGKTKVYRRLVDLPRIEWRHEPLQLVDVVTGTAKVIESSLEEGEVRDVIKGSWDGSDLESFRSFLYPFYFVELSLKGRRREIWLDGRTGRPVESS